MSPQLRKHPFLVPTTIFIVGILISDLLPGTPETYYVLGISVLLLVFLFLHQYAFFRVNNVQTLIMFFCLLVFGICRSMQQERQHQKYHFSRFISSDTNLLAGIVTTAHHNRLILDVERINRHNALGKLSVYSEKPLRVGQRIFFQTNIKEIDPPRNPYAFDFKSYYSRKEIWYQAYVSDEPLILDTESGFVIWMNNLRDRCDEILKRFLPSDNDYSLARALILGDKKELGEELKEAYADSGAMHVLAVSGLHVGVVYLLLISLLKKILPISFPARIVRSSLVVLGLWFFVYLVGAPASAWRATLMFSLFELGILFSRSYYPVNTLAFAAFLMLLIDTNSLYDVGFQLSFLAVLGIVTSQRAIQDLWKISNPIGFKIWQLVSLSIAAQLFTFPLTIFYFHQFPGYFWLSGILAVPLAFLVLMVGLILLVLAWVYGLNIFLGYLLMECTSALNGWILLLQSLPGLVIEGLWINEFQLCILLLISISLLLFITHPCYPTLKTVLLCCLVFLVTTSFKRWQNLHQALLVAYADRSQQFVDLIIGETAYPLHPPKLEEMVSEDIQRSRCGFGVKAVDMVSHENDGIFKRAGFFGFGGHRFFYQNFPVQDLSKLPSVHILFTRQIDQIEELGNFSELTTKIVVANSLDSQFRSNNIEFNPASNIYNTHRDGALIIDLLKP